MGEALPHDQLARLATGYWISQAIYVAAKLGLADLLGGGPQTAEQLADATGSHAPSLYRLLRALASVGVFAVDQERRFALTPLAQCLKSDVPGSQRAMTIMMGEEHFRAWGELLHSVRTGEPAFEKIYGQGVFEFLAEHPEQGRIFDEAMSGIHGRETGAMLEAYDFFPIRTLADVGGGNGSVLRSLLKKHPQMRGILFDLPDVMRRARADFEAAGLLDRSKLVSGDFFESVAGGADAYLLRHIIHDWDDAKALRIIENIRRVIPQDGRLLLIESVIPPGNDEFMPKLLDLTMLVIPCGKERTEQEYRELLERGGFHLERIVPTSTDISVIEAHPAW